MNNHKFQKEITEAKRRQAQRYKEQKYAKNHHGKHRRKRKHRQRLTVLERIVAILTVLAVVSAAAFCVCYIIDIKQKVTATKHLLTVYRDERFASSNLQSTSQELFAAYQGDERDTNGGLKLIPGEYYRFRISFNEKDLAAFWGAFLDSDGLAGPLDQELHLQVRYPNAIGYNDTGYLSIALFADECPTIYQDIKLRAMANLQLYIVGGWETKFYHVGELIGEFPKEDLVSSASGLFLSRTDPLFSEDQQYFDECIEFLIYVDYMRAGLPDSEFTTIANEWHKQRNFEEISRAPYENCFYIFCDADGEIFRRGSTMEDRARRQKTE